MTEGRPGLTHGCQSPGPAHAAFLPNGKFKLHPAAHKGEERSMLTPESETSPMRHFYGPDPSQFADLHLPAGRRRPGTVVLIHGGWWGPRFGADNLNAVAADLAGDDRQRNGRR